MERTIKNEIIKIETEIKQIGETENNEQKEGIIELKMNSQNVISLESNKIQQVSPENTKENCMKEIKEESSLKTIQSSEDGNSKESKAIVFDEKLITDHNNSIDSLNHKNLEKFNEENKNENKETEVFKEQSNERKDQVSMINDANKEEMKTINFQNLGFEGVSKEDIIHQEFVDEYSNESVNISDQFSDYQTKSLITILLEFLDNEKEINILLSGYFTKIILSLIKIERTALLNLLLEKHWIERLIYHSYSKSISEILIKILSSEDNLGESESKDKTLSLFDSRRREVINSILLKMIESEDNDIILSLTFIYCKIMETKVMDTFLHTQFVLDKLL